MWVGCIEMNLIDGMGPSEDVCTLKEQLRSSHISEQGREDLKFNFFHGFTSQ